MSQNYQEQQEISNLMFIVANSTKENSNNVWIYPKFE
jgi:hypothetical protein